MPATDQYESAQLTQEETKDQTGVFEQQKKDGGNRVGSTNIDAILGLLNKSKPDYKTFRLIEAHPTVALVNSIVGSPIIANSYDYIIKDKDKQEDAQLTSIVEFLKTVIDPLHFSMVKNCLTTLNMGWFPGEKIWKIARTKKWGEKLVIDRIKPLKIDYTDPIVDENGNVIGLSNKLPGKPKTNLYDEKFFIYSYDGDCGNPFGRPRSKNLVDNGVWDSLKRTLKRIDNYIKTISGPQLAIYYPEGTDKDKSGSDMSNYVNAQRLSNMASQGATLFFPNMAGNVNDPETAAKLAHFSKWFVEVLKTHSTDYSNGILAVLAYFDAMAFRAYLRPERTGLESKHGSRADSKQHTDTGLTDCELLDQEYARAINLQIVNPVIRMNFGDEFVDEIEIKPGKQQGQVVEIYKAILTGLYANSNPQVLAALLAKTDVDRLLEDADVPINPDSDGPIEIDPNPPQVAAPGGGAMTEANTSSGPLDPITGIGQQISNILQNNAALGDMAVCYESPEGDDVNFVRFRPDIQPGDLPEIAIVQEQFNFSPSTNMNNSAVDFGEQTYVLALVIDGMQTPQLNAIKTAINATLKLAGCGGLNLGLPGLVYSYTTRNCRDNCFGGKEWTRSTLRWWAVMAVKVEYYLTPQALIDVANGTYAVTLPLAPG